MLGRRALPAGGRAPRLMPRVAATDASRARCGLSPNAVTHRGWRWRRQRGGGPAVQPFTEHGEAPRASRRSRRHGAAIWHSGGGATPGRATEPARLHGARNGHAEVRAGGIAGGLPPSGGAGVAPVALRQEPGRSAGRSVSAGALLSTGSPGKSLGPTVPPPTAGPGHTPAAGRPRGSLGPSGLSGMRGSGPDPSAPLSAPAGDRNLTPRGYRAWLVGAVGAGAGLPASRSFQFRMALNARK